MRELTQKQLWLLKMLFEEDITTDEIQRYRKDNPPRSRGGLKSKIRDEEVTAEEPITERDHRLPNRRTKGKHKTN